LPNIKDVANHAGVSVTTVSRIMNNRGYISEATRKKVYESMEILNYHPNEMAKSLYTKKSNLIGLILPDVSIPFYAEETKYIEEALYMNGYKLLLCNASNNSVREKEYIAMLQRNQVDGIIIGSHTLKLEEYMKLKLPIVALDRYLGKDIPVVSADHMQGGYLAANELIRCGCKDVLQFVGNSQVATPANEKNSAFAETMKKNNINCTSIEFPVNFFSFENYLPFITKALDNHPNIDGIFAVDTIALAVIKELLSRKLKIPDDIKIVGYDGIALCNIATPTLTTIKQPIRDIANSAVSTILYLISNHNTMIPNDIKLPLMICQGQTT
jgi:DNA-binding LacI/PurR family transcriptional regulator